MTSDRFVSVNKKYQRLSLRGFHRQTFIPEHILELQAAMNLIDSFGWRATVAHIPAFSHILIREFLANLDEGGSIAQIRGELFQVSSNVVN